MYQEGCISDHVTVMKDCNILLLPIDILMHILEYTAYGSTSEISDLISTCRLFRSLLTVKDRYGYLHRIHINSREGSCRSPVNSISVNVSNTKIVCGSCRKLYILHTGRNTNYVYSTYAILRHIKFQSVYINVYPSYINAREQLYRDITDSIHRDNPNSIVHLKLYHHEDKELFRCKTGHTCCTTIRMSMEEFVQCVGLPEEDEFEVFEF